MDRRIIKTKAAIKASYKKLLMENNNSKITITELARLANIDRKTFYLHYDSVDSIIQEIMEENLSELEDELASKGLSIISFDTDNLIHAMNSCIDKDFEFYNAISHRTDFDFFVKELKKVFIASTANIIQETTDLPEDEILIYCKYIVCGLTDVYVDWFRNNSSMSLDELGIIVGKIMNENIQIFRTENQLSHFKSTRSLL